MEGSYQEIQSGLFRVLAGYIFGKNSAQEDIAMTAPVLMQANATQEGKSEEIAMTAPVMMERSKDGLWTMAFTMPSNYTMDTIPRPLDERVRLVEIPQGTLAVIRFSGSINNLEKRQKKAGILAEWIRQNTSYQAVGSPVFAGYDPPSRFHFCAEMKSSSPSRSCPAENDSPLSGCDRINLRADTDQTHRPLAADR